MGLGGMIPYEPKRGKHYVKKHKDHWTGHLNGTTTVFFSFDRMTWYEPDGRPTGTDVHALFRKLTFELEQQQEDPND